MNELKTEKKKVNKNVYLFVHLIETLFHEQADESIKWQKIANSRNSRSLEHFY